MANLEPVVLEIIGKDNTSSAFDSASKSVRENKKYVDNLVQSMQRYRDELGMSEKDIKLNRLAHKGATIAVQRQVAALYDEIEAKKKSIAASSSLTKNLRFMRGGFGQVGHQVQDIAVQLQMGTNAMVVFGQQGSQIASLFGPGGAVIGAVLAVAAAIGVAFVNRVEDANDAVKELSSEMDDFIDRTGRFNSEFAEFLRLQARKELEAQKKRFSELEESLESSEARLLLLSNAQKEANEMAQQAEDPILRAIYANKDYSERIQEVTDRIIAERTELRKLKLQIYGMDSSYKEDAESRLAAANRKIEAASKELDAIVESKQRQDEAESASLKARMAVTKQLHSINNAEMEALIEADQRKQELADNEQKRQKASVEARLYNANLIINQASRELEAIVEAERKKREAQNQTMANNSLLASNMQQITGSIISNMDKQSGAYKALFALQQALAIAQTIIQYETAIAQAKGQLGIFGLPMEALLRAQQVAAVSVIAGQTLASFEGGGITFNGARSGGLDGKGGRMAVVHPNEKITDLEKEGDSPRSANITFNIQANDARGFDELLMRRRGMITSMVNQALNNQGRRLGR